MKKEEVEKQIKDIKEKIESENDSLEKSTLEKELLQKIKDLEVFGQIIIK